MRQGDRFRSASSIGDTGMILIDKVSWDNHASITSSRDSQVRSTVMNPMAAEVLESQTPSDVPNNNNNNLISDKVTSNAENDKLALMNSSHGLTATEIATDGDDFVPFAFPSKPTFYDYLFFVPNAIHHSLSNMSKAFGWKFVVMVVIVYGFQQGMGNAFFFFARDYYFKDVEKLEPADAQTVIAVSMTPWNIKPLYGMLSDSVAIYGYHRIPYIMLAGTSGGISLFLLSAIPLTTVLAVTLMFFVNTSVSSPDVMIDGVIAERVKSHPKYATDLQSLCWGSQSLFAIVGHLSSGYAVNTFGSKAIFGALVLTSMAITVSASLNWLGEVPDSEAMAVAGKVTYYLGKTIKVDLKNFYTHHRIFMLAFVISALALLLSIMALLISSWLPRLIIVLSVTAGVVASVWIALRKTLPDVASAALFIFFANAIVPDIDTAMFYWITDDPNGPQFDPPFMGYISAGSFAAMFMGVLLYNYYFSSWSYQSIFSFAIVLMAFMNVFDVIIVQRWNLLFGIPDKMLALGDSALSPVARRLLALPMVILAAKVCPAGAEATLFALMMALSNFGAAVSVYSGALMLKLLNISNEDFSRLTIAIIIKACFRLSTLLAIPFLVPKGSPSDPSENNEMNNSNDSLVSAMTSNLSNLSTTKLMEEEEVGMSNRLEKAAIVINNISSNNHRPETTKI